MGGSRFTGLYLWKELHQRGHQVTLFNRGKTEIRQIPSETIEEFVDRKSKTKYIIGDRKDTKGMIEKLVCGLFWCFGYLFVKNLVQLPFIP